MTVSTIASIAAGLARTSGDNNARAAALFNNLLGAKNTSNSQDKGDIANLTIALSLQNQVAKFRVASQDVAQASSLIDTAQGGANEILTQLTALKDLATQAAAPELTADARAALDTKFQETRAKIDAIVTKTTFNGESLLDGSSPQLRVGAEGGSSRDFSIGSLTDSTLFKGTNPSIATASGAKVAEATVRAAFDYAAKQITNLNNLQSGLDLAASTLQSAVENQDALRSTLSDNDFTSQLLGQNDAVNAFATGALNVRDVQIKRLPPSLIQLISL